MYSFSPNKPITLQREWTAWQKGRLMPHHWSLIRGPKPHPYRSISWPPSEVTISFFRAWREMWRVVVKDVFTEPFNSSDFLFPHLSSGHRMSTLFPMGGCCENQRRSHQWKCLGNWLASSRWMGPDAFICTWGSKPKEQKKSKIGNWHFGDHLLCFWYCRRLYKTSSPSQHPWRQSLTFLFHKWGNEVGWSASRFAHDKGFPGA